MADIKQETHSVAEDTVHAVVGWGAIGLTYNWLAHFVNMVAGAFMPGRDGPVLPMLFDFQLAGGHLFPILWPVWYCIIIGFFTYVVIRWVCERQWVKVTYVLRVCWQINPFGIVFCFFKVVSVWVLRIICRWRYYVISVPIWFCFVIWIWRLF